MKLLLYQTFLIIGNYTYEDRDYTYDACIQIFVTVPPSVQLMSKFPLWNMVRSSANFTYWDGRNFQRRSSFSDFQLFRISVRCLFIYFRLFLINPYFNARPTITPEICYFSKKTISLENNLCNRDNYNICVCYFIYLGDQQSQSIIIRVI